MSHINSANEFAGRHLGVNEAEISEMLKTIGVKAIRRKGKLKLPAAQSEHEYLTQLKTVASKNKVFKSYIGQGYHDTITPSVILRGVFQNPGWYTQYTPYQAEIAQGRLEGLLNFQTMVSDLTGLPIANASLLDEATAAAEAMAMFFSVKNKRAKGKDIATDFLVSDKVLKHTIDVLVTRAEPIGIKVKVMPVKDFKFDDNTFGILLQYPNKEGSVEDYRALSTKANSKKVFVTVATDILSLALLKPPGEWGADAVVGSTQRMGVPMGFGGPHAAYFSTKEDFKRLIPGRIIGVSQDSNGNRALRMALQTREQHIRREKATSNICTAQALLANMAGFYAVYHGPNGVKNIATHIHTSARFLSDRLNAMGLSQTNEHYFDTVRVEADATLRRKVRTAALRQKMNFFFDTNGIQINVDETTTIEDLKAIIEIFESASGKTSGLNGKMSKSLALPKALKRSTEYLTHPVFNSHHTESKMMRYLKRLENKDISLVHSMIPLGSCTMKLNAASEMFPVSWPEFANIHPFAPANQWKGYAQIFEELEAYLSEITGFTACSLQPNSGAQGEHAGLMVIRAYHKARKEGHRNISLIPQSAHGTNPASAVMAGMKVVVVKCDEEGNIDIPDLKEKALKHKDNLSSLMVTYPSTHGVYEEGIKEICKIVHDNGGLVYMDGANMNAQVGLTSPGLIDADVCHLNLHKTFAIPHGGGGPGMGPICVNDKLAPFLPKHSYQKTGGKKGIKAVSAAPWGSASILLISYGYIRMYHRHSPIQTIRRCRRCRQKID